MKSLLRLSAFLTLLPALVLAEPYLATESRQLRHDVQTLSDAGLLNRPTTTWPLPAGSLNELRGADLSGQPGYVVQALARVLKEADATGPRIRLRAAEKPDPRTHFGDQSLDEYGARLSVGWDTDWFGGRLQGEITDDTDRGTRETADGSYAALRLGNWLVSAGAQDRWWGPGWEGSLILGDNARPVPTIALERDDPKASELPVLEWLGPWNLTTFFGQLESDRDDASRPRFFGMRLTLNPLGGLEIGLSRTAQWGGGDRPEDWNSFWATFRGKSNRGDNNDIVGGDANQFGGYDLRWRSPIGEDAPYALYGQLIGVDEANYQPFQFMGLAGAEYWTSIGQAFVRFNLEVSDTEIEFYRNDRRGTRAYVHSFYTDGYRHRGRVMGHSMDGEGRMVSLGAQVSQSGGGYWHALIRHTEQNRNNGDNRAEGVEEKAKIVGGQLTHVLPYGAHRFTLMAGGDYLNEAEGSAQWIGRLSGEYEYRF